MGIRLVTCEMALAVRGVTSVCGRSRHPAQCRWTGVKAEAIRSTGGEAAQTGLQRAQEQACMPAGPQQASRRWWKTDQGPGKAEVSL